MIETAPPRPDRPTRRFRPASQTRLSDDQKRRQATVMAAAWRAFGDRDRTMAFLNEADDVLGGRPLDLAVDGEAGLSAVLDRLAGVPLPPSSSSERQA
ncbi:MULTISPECIES: antitoxin Xre/MbcA/ParS toxin-binding domain-containing protein [Sphingomonas]|uniref:antitoxin Xre/MbcA/ParS toxin-binding domain-containing protein n=1 Tax=Sphingomonas TaxID=13687 RepID=UPI00258FDD80|nr:antitoxin Xre/MbcA/ParS toxin-binding domain-containing protein [Sphingomonas sp.]